jgi:hypothetical protein
MQHPAQQRSSDWPDTFMSQCAKGLGGPKARIAAFAHAPASLTTLFRDRHGSFSLYDLLTMYCMIM